MRIILARCDLISEVSRRSWKDLTTFLESEDHQVEQLVLPTLGPLPESLSTVASHRLLELSASADVLLCMSATAALLPHRSKITWLLDPAPLGANPDGSRRLDEFRRTFLENTLLSALAETQRLFVPSEFAKSRLRKMGLHDGHLLRPPHIEAETAIRRNPGPELLCLGPLTERQRPHLLVDCLTLLPEPVRARWVAPNVDTDLFHRIRTKAEKSGVSHRLTLEVRPVDPHERAYLLSQSLAYVHLESESWLIGDALRVAASQRVPLIMCRDSGAPVEIVANDSVGDLPSADASALAKAVERIVSGGDPAAIGLVEKARRPRMSWGPLLRAMIL